MPKFRVVDESEWPEQLKRLMDAVKTGRSAMESFSMPRGNPYAIRITLDESRIGLFLVDLEATLKGMD